MRLFRTTGTFLFAAVTALAASGCTFLTGVRNVSRVSVSVSPSVISINQTAAAFGAAFDGSDALQGQRYAVTFTSRNPAVATVNAISGLVIGVANGTTYIIGENNGKRDSAMITVRPVLAKQVIISARAPVYRVGAINGLGATILDTLGNGIGGRAIVWTSRTPAVLTITSAGIVTPLATGTSWVVASVDNGPGTSPTQDSVLATVTPTPVTSIRITPNNDNNNVPTVYLGQTLPFTAVLTDSLANTVTRPVVWSTPNPGLVLTIDPTSGLATPVTTSNNYVNVTATVDVVPGYVSTLGTRSATVYIQVLAPVSTVKVFNNGGTAITTLTLSAGSTTALTLVPYDNLNNTLGGRTFRLTSSNPAVATVQATSSSNGTTPVSAIGSGTTTITIQALDTSGAPQGTAATLTVTVP